MRRIPALLFAGSAAGLVALHYALFARFFPNSHGKLGNDYSYFLPHLLDGLFWYRKNGPLAVPWFTPSFCAGMPKFPNPQALYYSFPQLATVLSDPLTALKLTLVSFAALGVWGFVLLQRRCFGLGRSTALLGATLFLFNGLYASRMLVGHLTFHAFMLAPLLFFLLLRPVGAAGPDSRWRFGFEVVCAALIIAYVATTALPHVLFPLLLAALAVALLRAGIDPAGFEARAFAGRFALSGVLALGISAAKLVAMESFLGSFPRSFYPLAGVASLSDLFRLLGRALFLDVVRAYPGELVVNSAVHIAPAGFDFGIGGVPLALLLGAALAWGYQLLWLRSRPRIQPLQWAAASALVLVLALPLALNYYTPGWNQFLKTLPLVRNSTTNLRWFSIYIPFLILLSTLALERTPRLRSARLPIAWLGIGITVYLAHHADRSYYEAQLYDPKPVLAASRALRSGSSPSIARVGVSRDQQGRELMSFYGNTTLVQGETQLLCYETLFGFRLEALPRGATRQGRVFSEDVASINIKDPSCYLFPQENGCRPGDHFREARRQQALAFTSYTPFEFQMPPRQKLANALSLASLSGVLLFLAAFCARRVRRWAGSLSPGASSGAA